MSETGHLIQLIIMRAEENLANRQQPIELVWHMIQRKNNSTHLPKPRFKHQCFIYDNTLYMVGGVPTHAQSQNFDESLDIHLFNLSKHHERWEKSKMKCTSKQWELVSGHCGAVRNNQWYTFGGINKEFKTNNNLWRLNIPSLELTKIQGAGNIPTGREGAFLFVLDNSWLLLHGGINTQLVEIYNSFYLFNIQSRVWCKCEGTYLHQAYCRHDPALCCFNNKVYIFGGTYRNIDNEEHYLNDLYEAEVRLPSAAGSSLPLVATDNITMKRLYTVLAPQPRAGHSLSCINGQYLLLLGGQNSGIDGKQGIKIQTIKLIPNCWIYSIARNTWTRVKLNPSTFVYSTQFSCTPASDNKFYIFGGLNCYTLALNNLVQFEVNPEALQRLKQPDCTLCPLTHKKKTQNTGIPSILLQDLAYNIEFPFAAVGLLVDNAFHHGATLINITYEEFIKDNIRVFKIADNAKLPWTEEQFIQTMCKFSTEPMQIPAGTDKKIKTSLLREHAKRQFGTNAKLASARLGAGFLHISLSENSQLLRVVYFRKAKERYLISYYICQRQTMKVVSPQMEQLQQQLQESYGVLIKGALHSDERNSLIILAPKIQQFNDNISKHQLKVCSKHNDIINASVANFKELEQRGYNVLDCVDVSLRAYLISLYLKNDLTKIYLSVKNLHPTLIPTQTYLDRIDKLCKQKYIFEINSVVQFDFKIFELYYLYDIKKKLFYFNNGLLIYHKNRLILRYKYPLGELLPRKMYKAEGNHNFVRMLGFIELPDHIPINALLTNVLHPIMMEKLYSRLQLISKMFKAGFQNLAQESSVKRAVPTKLSQAEIKEDLKQNPEFGSQNNKSLPFVAEQKDHKEQSKQNKNMGVVANGHKQLLMPKGQNNKRHIKKLKRNTAVTFNPEQRSSYLKGLIGAKKRRRDFYHKKVQIQQREEKQQERAGIKAQRREQLNKAKQLLQKLTEQAEQKLITVHEAKQKDKVQVNKANNLIVETKFY